jgi:DNA repair ATPase RecN
MADVKNYILRTKKRIDNIRKNDQKAKQFIEEIEEQIVDIKKLLGQIQTLEATYPDINERTEMMMLINENLEDLNNLHKITKKEYNDYIIELDNNLQEFKTKYPGLFDQFTFASIDLEALDHCLNTYVLYKDGEITEENAKERGYNKYMKPI